MLLIGGGWILLEVVQAILFVSIRDVKIVGDVESTNHGREERLCFKWLDNFVVGV